MRATILGIAAIALAGLAMPAQAAPLSVGTGFAPDNAIEQARVVRRTVVRGPRCKTVITKRRGPLGRVTVVRKRQCF
ncbi:hypothetical protein ASG40_05475 [Methylobacterium sp. Leaf399]|uniref:hypothetical protein n=1 Tax=unclassified Methylobacterium TaxID=2615210 RepID=UPI0006F6DA1F|nr:MULTISPECIES: hypothetical protein [unclassified Methylobacterium]KQP51824.1 hypothetical protein ASF39_08650 [Methylobacterium sp. Leaf108]KQT14757.1 hypothetical protein ASG40_05475 [Methylobacterium sp. Leaf399]KQT90423.1 hypothetical protein ASG59_01095 [Methylobacterium sp. Leaf466]